MPLNAKSFGLTAGIMWGICLMVMTLLSLSMDYATDLLNALAKLYPGYSVSPFGAIIGLVYGFLDCFIGLYIFALLYNWLEKKLG